MMFGPPSFVFDRILALNKGRADALAVCFRGGRSAHQLRASPEGRFLALSVHSQGRQLKVDWRPPRAQRTTGIAQSRQQFTNDDLRAGPSVGAQLDP
jgi:hypothetical protein